MPYQGFSDGLYVMKQFRADKGVFHFAIMDVGNRLRLTGVQPGTEPVMVHQPPEGLRADFLGQTIGTWSSLGKVADEAKARERLLEAMKTPEYNLFGNNCEHFVNFVASGMRRSTQLLIGGLVVVGVVAYAMFGRSKAA